MNQNFLFLTWARSNSRGFHPCFAGLQEGVQATALECLFELQELPEALLSQGQFLSGHLRFAGRPFLPYSTT